MTATGRAEDLPLRGRATAFAVLLLVEFLYGWSWNSVDVLRPHIRASLHLTLVQAGSFYSAQAAGALTGALLLGQLADRIGRRRVLAGGVVAMAVLLAVGAAARTYPAMLAQRALLGVAMGALPPTVGRLYIDLFPAGLRGRMASLLNAVFTGSVVALGYGLAALAAASEWRGLLVLGATGLLAALPALLLVPDRHRAGPPGAAAPSPLLALFAPSLRRMTLLLIAMAGLNYFAAQAFTGWTASYLTEVRGLAPPGVAAALAAQAVGSVTGGFFWGWFGDRFGRRVSLIGYVFGAAFMVVYVVGLRDAAEIRAVAFLVGFAIAASVVWPPWMAEIFPAAIRATALSIFNWGRIVSLFAPVVTGAVAERRGLAAAMLLGPASLLGVVAIWRMFPETLIRARPNSQPG